jgi:hypothetical protein
MLERCRVVASAGVLRACRGPEQDSGGVDLILAQRQAVPDGGTGDDVGAQLCSGAEDENLQRLGRVLRLLVRPEPIHEPGGAAPGTQVTSQERKQVTQPGGGDLPAAVGHLPQQGQLGSHPNEAPSRLCRATVMMPRVMTSRRRTLPALTPRCCPNATPATLPSRWSAWLPGEPTGYLRCRLSSRRRGRVDLRGGTRNGRAAGP